jgi:hypothetical protein
MVSVVLLVLEDVDVLRRGDGASFLVIVDQHSQLGEVHRSRGGGDEG